jgi:5-formyltetrahydrofolate cyclo-ligase
MVEEALNGIDRDEVELRSRKITLRRSLLTERAQMTGPQRSVAGRSLRDAVLSMPEAQMAGTVAAYISVGTEPETRGLVYAL